MNITYKHKQVRKAKNIISTILEDIWSAGMPKKFEQFNFNYIMYVYLKYYI